MKRLGVLVAVIALVAVGCGGGDDSSQEAPDSTASPATTAPPTTLAASTADAATDAPTETSPPDTPDFGSGSSSDFCRSAADIENDDFSLFAFNSTPADLEAGINEVLALLEEASRVAPSEIADDFDVLRQTFVDFAGLLADYNYDFFAIASEAENDPRLIAFDGDAVEQAANNIAAFCGIDVEPPESDPVNPPPVVDVPDVMVDGLPDGFPEALVPPGVESVESFDTPGLQSVSITSSAAFDDIVDFYTAVVGAPLGIFDDGSGQAAAFVAELDGASVNISITDEGDTRLVAIGLIDL